MIRPVELLPTMRTISELVVAALAGAAQRSKLMRHICREGFEYHAAMNTSQVGLTLADSFETHLDPPTHVHELEGD
jgi:hypothetical protein